jgi:hypothetical protein
MDRRSVKTKMTVDDEEETTVVRIIINGKAKLFGKNGSL